MEEANSQEWCRRLYEQKAAGLILYGRSFGLSHSEAEDLVQETFIALLKRELIPADPMSYLVRIFRNRALNFHRGLLRRIRRELESSRWFESAGEHDDLEERAVKCLEALPAEQREVIVLKIWQQLTFEQIAEITAVSSNTAAGRYRYGMQKMKAALDTKDTYEHLERTRASTAFVEPQTTVAKA